jgi:hypothetical protein
MRTSFRAIGAYHLLVVFVLLFAACSKTGPMGATGATGSQGIAGLQGQTGPAGSRIFSGSGAPADTLGLVGDFYIDEKASALYGSKVISGWGQPVSLKGAQGIAGVSGAPGAAGSQILSGTTIPDNSIGTPGDYYFDNLTDSLYGPKTNAGWGTAASLRGATGAANVISYNWVAFNASSWSGFNVGSHNRTYAQINMPALSSGILNGGVVLVYLQFIYVQSNDTLQQTFSPAPTQFYNNLVNNQFESLMTEFEDNQLRFSLADAGDNNDPGTLYVYSYLSTRGGVGTYSGYLYRVIIIPGGVAGTAIDLPTLSYKETCIKYGIQP